MMSSIFNASTTTPILKSANSSLNRKKVHDRIRNTVQFQLINENGLRNVLEDAANGENIGAYDDYIRAMRDSELSDADFAVLIKESRQNIELLQPVFSVFVETLISLNWIRRNETLIIEYQIFLLDLLSEHNKYTSFALKNLIQFWLPARTDEHLWKNGVPDDQIKFFLNHIHRTLNRITDVIPMAKDILIDTIERMFPYYTKSSFIVAGYVHNVIWLLEYRPMFREDVLMLLFKNFVMMDVSVPRADIEASERPIADVEEIFTMDSEDLRSFNEIEMHLPIAETIDTCMYKLYKYITEQCQNNEVRNGQLDHMYKILVKCFENYILPTHKTNHVQFIMFYFCSLKLSITEAFLNYLCYKVWNPNIATPIRQSAVGYIASMLARAKYIPQGLIKRTLQELCNWAHNYIQKSDSTQNTNFIKAHLVFYAVCEAIFYVIAFRSHDLTSTNENLSFLQSLQLSTLVTCHLNPLRVCQSAVATAFAGVTRAHQLAYCHTILERNARRKLATVYRNEVMLPEETLDTTFPFDPYLLKKSSEFITKIYQHYQPSEAEEVNGSGIHSSPIEQRRRRRIESVNGVSSFDDDDFLNEHKRNKLSDFTRNYEKELLFTYGTSPGFH